MSDAKGFIEGLAESVRSGVYGQVFQEWRSGDGWPDGYQVPFFLLDRDGRKMIVKVTLAGVLDITKGHGIQIHPLPSESSSDVLRPVRV